MSEINQMPLIRSMTQEDLPGVYHLELLGEDPWSKGILRDCIIVGYDCWVLASSEALEGFAVMSMLVDECHILNLRIRPQVQRRGYGRQLLLHLLKRGKELGAHSAFLEVRASNEAALALYHQQGFQAVGIRKDYYPLGNDREDAIILSKDLTRE